jgi:glycosyltransferase involved in cell wall biosynthesis
VIEAFGVESRKVTTIYPGVTAAFVRRSRQEVLTVLSRLRVPDQAYVIGFLGTDPRKNTAKLLEAWVKSQAVKHNAHLILFGRVANLAVFADSTLPAEVEGVIRVGAVDDDSLAALYSGAAGFVFPSFYEGFGLPIIEAAHCGARIVTSKVTSMPEVSPTDAILIDPSDTAVLADAIRHLIAVSDTDEARNRRIEEMTKFRWERAVKQYSQLFAEVFA